MADVYFSNQNGFPRDIDDKAKAVLGHALIHHAPDQPSLTGTPWARGMELGERVIDTASYAPGASPDEWTEGALKALSPYGYRKALLKDEVIGDSVAKAVRIARAAHRTVINRTVTRGAISNRMTESEDF